jgi:hypothetical protein
LIAAVFVAATAVAATAAFAVVVVFVFLVCHSERSERTCFLPFFACAS